MKRGILLVMFLLFGCAEYNQIPEINMVPPGKDDDIIILQERVIDLNGYSVLNAFIEVEDETGLINQGITNDSGRCDLQLPHHGEYVVHIHKDSSNINYEVVISEDTTYVEHILP